MRGAMAAPICCVAALVAACGMGGCSSKAKAKPPLIGVLMAGDFRQPVLDGLKDGMARLGYPAGRIEYRVLNAKVDTAALPRLAEELVAAHPAILCPLGGVEAVACAAAAKGRIPVVFMNVTSPIEHGLVQSYAKPPPNVTGVRTGYDELAGKRLEILTLFFPRVKTVSVLHEPGSVESEEGLTVARQVAPALGLQLKPVPLRNLKDVEELANTLKPEEHEILFGLPATVIYAYRKDYIIPAGLRAKVPFFGFDPQSAAEGAVVAYGNDPYAFGTSGAELVKAVLDGKRPSELPVRFVERIHLVINRKSMRALGLAFPPELEALATEAIE